MARAHRRASELARRLQGLADPRLRVSYLRHTVAAMAPEELADLVTVAVHRTEARDGPHGALLLALCVALADALPLREAAAQAAAARGQHETASLLSARAVERGARVESPSPDRPAGRALTLGERKALARRRDRDLLARVLRDPHPDVIRVVLGNPTLTEDHVLRLCARRPGEPEVLREVFRSTRWIVRYRVRRAIVMNPAAPLDVALQLAIHLNATDARAVAAMEELEPPVRDTCRRVAGLATLH